MRRALSMTPGARRQRRYLEKPEKAAAHREAVKRWREKNRKTMNKRRRIGRMNDPTFIPRARLDRLRRNRELGREIVRLRKRVTRYRRLLANDEARLKQLLEKRDDG